MNNLQKFKSFEISKETSKKIAGGSIPNNYELETGNYGNLNSLDYELNPTTYRVIWAKVYRDLGIYRN